jgi:predicted RNase H-like nuclease (RuvC/YqgF family)
MASLPNSTPENMMGFLMYSMAASNRAVATLAEEAARKYRIVDDVESGLIDVAQQSAKTHKTTCMHTKQIGKLEVKDKETDKKIDELEAKLEAKNTKVDELEAKVKEVDELKQLVMELMHANNSKTDWDKMAQERCHLVKDGESSGERPCFKCFLTLYSSKGEYARCPQHLPEHP